MITLPCGCEVTRACVEHAIDALSAPAISGDALSGKPKHTPAPWAVEDCRSELVIHHDKFDIAIVGIDPTYEYNLEQRANAKLIAAAPEMAEVLRQFVIYMRSDDDGGEGVFEERMERFADKARAALARTGVL